MLQATNEEITHPLSLATHVVRLGRNVVNPLLSRVLQHWVSLELPVLPLAEANLMTGENDLLEAVVTAVDTQTAQVILDLELVAQNLKVVP